jgi:hypothetical protein
MLTTTRWGYKQEGRGFDSWWSHWNFSVTILPVTLWPLGRLSLLTEMSTRNSSWGLRRPVRRAHNLTTFVCRLCRNSGASASWNTKGLSRAVVGNLYLYLCSPWRHTRTWRYNSIYVNICGDQEAKWSSHSGRYILGDIILLYPVNRRKSGGTGTVLTLPGKKKIPFLCWEKNHCCSVVYPVA